MLAQLSTLKARLAITVSDYDTILTNALTAISVRFDNECNRTFTRTTSALHEFDSTDLEISVPCYPIETVTKFELKENETDGWIEQTDVEFLIRRSCIISLHFPLSTLNSQPSTCRLTYTGGYVLPGTTPDPGQTALPSDIEQAAIEQAAAWFQNRDKLGLIRNWPSGGTYQVFSQLDLLPNVAAVLRRYARLNP